MGFDAGERVETNPGNELLNPKQLALFLGMSLKWVEKYTQINRIPGQIRLGGSWRYRKVIVERRLATSPVFLLNSERNISPFRGA